MASSSEVADGSQLNTPHLMLPSSSCENTRVSAMILLTSKTAPRWYFELDFKNRVKHRDLAGSFDNFGEYQASESPAVTVLVCTVRLSYH